MSVPTVRGLDYADIRNWPLTPLHEPKIREGCLILARKLGYMPDYLKTNAPLQLNQPYPPEKRTYIQIAGDSAALEEGFPCLNQVINPFVQVAQPPKKDVLMEGLFRDRLALPENTPLERQAHITINRILLSPFFSNKEEPPVFEGSMVPDQTLIEAVQDGDHAAVFYLLALFEFSQEAIEAAYNATESELIQILLHGCTLEVSEHRVMAASFLVIHEYEDALRQMADDRLLNKFDF